jgi:hypothetical protein
MSLIKIVHMDHAGNKFGEVEGRGRSFQLQLNQSETVTYSLGLESPLASQAYCNPNYTDFIIYYKDKELCAGMHTEVDLNDVDANTLDVSGRGWLNYFETRIWPPINRDGSPHNDYSVTDRDMIFIAQDLIGYVSIWETPISLQVFFNNAASGQLRDYEIIAGDGTSSIFSQIEELAKGHPGFDFEITWDRVFKTYYPRKGTVRDYVFEQGINCGPIQYRNPGNGGNFFWGTGTDDSDAALTSWSWNDADILATRRRDILVDYGPIHFQENLDFLAQGEAARQVLPLKQISAEWRGDDRITNIFDQVSLGDIVLLRGDTGYEYINDWYRIVGMEVTPTDDDDERVTFTFDDGSLSL